MRTIDDSSNWIRYLVEDYERKPYYIRIGVWKVFSETGVMVSQGKYLPESFISSHPGLNIIKRGFESEDWFFPGGFKFFGWYSGCTSYLKDGEWIYYNEIGNEIYKENYKDGLPVKMK